MNMEREAELGAKVPVLPQLRYKRAIESLQLVRGIPRTLR